MKTCNVITIGMFSNCSGIVLSLVSGVFYGQMFTPAFYVMDNYADASSDGIMIELSFHCRPEVKDPVISHSEFLLVHQYAV